MVFSIIAAAAAPGCALLAYLYLRDRYDPEPIHLVARMFLCGALIVFPLMVLQRAFVLGFGENSFLFSFVYSSGMEEAAKWLILYVFIYKHVAFDEPYDGIVYAAAVSLGFATVENIIYALVNYSSFGQIVMRALLPVSGHALFAVFMGYYFGKAKFEPQAFRNPLALSFLLPVFYHGVFDYILTDYDSRWVWLIGPFMLFLWGRSLWKIKNAVSASPLRLALEEEYKLPV
ncbi:glutamic-type intramembrane protease PrsW [Gorillibacterium sp. CAU 1737]|uniref:glutamic-type intramembrane protease PrsW n=1 Tax=Gorillibacterium sp. CAU 1737 TaxID=3140362 RepID=UPI003260103B